MARTPSRIIDDLIMARQEFAEQEAANLVQGQETDTEGRVVAVQDRPKEEGSGGRGLTARIRSLKDEFDESITTLIDAAVEFARAHK